MDALTYTHWSLLAVGALIMGMSKGGIPGAGNLTVAIFALVLEDALGPVGVPLSVGLLLPVLISADVAATGVYRRHADWKYIVRLLPCFLIDTVLGWWVFDYFQGDDRVERQSSYRNHSAQHDSSSLYSAVRKENQGAVHTEENLHQKRPKDQLVLA